MKRIRTISRENDDQGRYMYVYECIYISLKTEKIKLLTTEMTIQFFYTY